MSVRFATRARALLAVAVLIAVSMSLAAGQRWHS
jgi:hypothetical protein